MARPQEVRPSRLNSTIGVLFMIGSACFVIGTVPVYVSAVGTLADAATFFLGSIFFTAASFCQLVQAQTPAMAPGQMDAPAALRFWNPQPRDRAWLSAATQFPGTLAFNASTLFAVNTSLTVKQTDRLVWAPDFVGSILFLVASAYAILAVSEHFWSWRARDPWWRIAWLNMVGSVFFMISAVGAVLIPATGSELDPRWANVGTFAGAICFFVGAALMLPAWKRSQ